MAQIGIIMGSQSDFPIMQKAVDIIQKFGISYQVNIVSAHRTPNRMVQYAEMAVTNGLQVIIAGAGGAAHLPGMVAALTTLPVIGVPIKSRNSIDGWDAVLSILQMPAGVPVATVALDGGENAGLLAIQIIGSHDIQIGKQLSDYKETLKNKTIQSDKNLN